MQRHFFIIFRATFQFHHSWITSQSLRHSRSPRPLWWGGYLRLWTTINNRGGGWGWKILEFKAPFNTWPSQRDLGKGERLGRRWQGLWSLVPLWHLGNRSWFPAVPLSVYAFLAEPLSACNHLLCLLLSFVLCLFFNYPDIWASPSLPNKTLSTSDPLSPGTFISFRFRGLCFTLLILSLKNMHELIYSNANDAS